MAFNAGQIQNPFIPFAPFQQSSVPFGFGVSPGIGLGGAQPIGFNPQQLMQFQQLLMTVLSAFQQLQGGYAGFLGGPQQNPFGNIPGLGLPQQPPNPYGGYGGYPAPSPYGGYPTGPIFPPNGPQPGPVFPPIPGPQPGGGIPSTGVTDARFYDWGAAANNGTSKSAISRAERNDISKLNDDQSAVLHLWGRQMTAGGKQDGSIYFNVLNDKSGAFTPAEHALVERLVAQEKQQFGGVTGKGLDQQFFGLYKDMTGEDISQRYGNAPVHFSNGQALNLSNDNQALGSVGNTVMRLWGHDRLDDGKNDGSILAFSLANPDKAFESDRSGADTGTLRALAAADGKDGRLDGNSLASAFKQVMDQAYLGGPQLTNDTILAQGGVNKTEETGILDKIKNSNFPGIPPGIDITNVQNIGKCPMFKAGVTGQTQIRN